MRMRRGRVFGRCGIFLLAIVLVAALSPGAALFAQALPIAQRLSPHTLFYVEWRGMASLRSAENKNHLLQLLQDPDFAPVWAALASNFQQRRHGQSGAAPVALPDLLSLLDNPAAFGLIENPKASRSNPAGGDTSPVGFFLVYEATGKTKLIEAWESSHPAPGTAAPEVTHYDFGGTQVEVRTLGKNVSYTARAGNYYLVSDQKKVTEDLVARFRSSERPAASLDQLPEYQAAHKFVGNDSALEFFGRMPDWSRWLPTDAKDKTGAELLKNLHLEKIRVAEGGIEFAGEAVRFRGAILGDTSPGGPFDLAAPSVATFQTQQMASAAPTFTLSRLNLAATYEFVRTAVMANLPARQTANFTTFESAAQSFLGMPVTDALGLFSGEVASMSSYSTDGAEQRLFAATIQKPDAVLRVLRAVIGPMIANEDALGNTTYLDISYPYRDPATGMQRRKFHYVAVTPQMILAAPRKAMLRQAVAQSGSAADATPPSGMFANAEMVQLRARLPEKLSGLSAADITQIPWDQLLADLEERVNRAAKQSKSSPPPDLTLLKAFKPGVIPRHLHFTLSGWWKDANGLYFDSYLQ